MVGQDWDGAYMELNSPFLIPLSSYSPTKRARQENDVLIISVFVNPTVRIDEMERGEADRSYIGRKAP